MTNVGKRDAESKSRDYLGAADIAIIPAIEYQRISNLVVLPDLAIAAQNRVRSLLIAAKKPIEQVRSMALDRSSRSTQALTRILAEEHWKIAPEFFETEPDLRLVTLPQAAAYLSVSRGALDGLLSSGHLSSVHIGRSRRIAMVELHRFVLDRMS